MGSGSKSKVKITNTSAKRISNSSMENGGQSLEPIRFRLEEPNAQELPDLLRGEIVSFLPDGDRLAARRDNGQRLGLVPDSRCPELEANGLSQGRVASWAAMPELYVEVVAP